MLENIHYENINQFYLAISRLNYSYSRNRIEDKVIDLAICLEALCSKEDDGIDSVTHKLSVRFARLLKDTLSERKEIFEEIGRFYRLRSKVIHGNNKEKKKYLNRVNLDSIEGHIRSAIKLYVAKSNQTKLDHDQLIQSLDLG